jgi:hypothetical protein
MACAVTPQLQFTAVYGLESALQSRPLLPVIGTMPRLDSSLDDSDDGTPKKLSADSTGVVGKQEMKREAETEWSEDGPSKKGRYALSSANSSVSSGASKDSVSDMRHPASSQVKGSVELMAAPARPDSVDAAVRQAGFEQQLRIQQEIDRLNQELLVQQQMSQLQQQFHLQARPSFPGVPTAASLQQSGAAQRQANVLSSLLLQRQNQDNLFGTALSSGLHGLGGLGVFPGQASRLGNFASGAMDDANAALSMQRGGLPLFMSHSDTSLVAAWRERESALEERRLLERQALLLRHQRMLADASAPTMKYSGLGGLSNLELQQKLLQQKLHLAQQTDHAAGLQASNRSWAASSSTATLSPSTSFAHKPESTKQAPDAKSSSQPPRATLGMVVPTRKSDNAGEDRLMLGIDEDHSWLSRYHCYVRSEIAEVFVATEDDCKGRSHSVRVGPILYQRRSSLPSWPSGGLPVVIAASIPKF